MQHEWLVQHGIIKSDYQKKRDALTKQMQRYYYDVNDSVWSTWSESDLKAWLVKHDIIKSDAQIRKDKAVKLVQDNYSNAADTLYGGWKDSEIRAWLVEHGYLQSDAQVKRDQLLKLFSDKYVTALPSYNCLQRLCSGTTTPLHAQRRTSHGLTPGSVPSCATTGSPSLRSPPRAPIFSVRPRRFLRLATNSSTPHRRGANPLCPNLVARRDAP